MKSIDIQSIQHANTWLNDQGYINFSILQDLARDESPETAETLAQIAEDYNIPYNQNTNRETLVNRIRLAMEQEADNE